MLISPPHWNRWALDPESYTLVRVTGTGTDVFDYPIPLDQCRDPANVLDWIFQVHGRWGDAEGGVATIAGFLRALDDLLNPQANLCSFGQAKTLRGKQLQQLVDDYAAGRGLPGH